MRVNLFKRPGNTHKGIATILPATDPNRRSPPPPERSHTQPGDNTHTLTPSSDNSLKIPPNLLQTQNPLIGTKCQQRHNRNGDNARNTKQFKVLSSLGPHGPIEDRAYKYHKPKGSFGWPIMPTDNTRPHHRPPSTPSHFQLFFFFDFFQAGRTLAWFSLLVLRCGSGWQIKAQAAARVGRSGTSEEGAAYPPAA